jgi:hypothetical protein
MRYCNKNTTGRYKAAAMRNQRTGTILKNALASKRTREIKKRKENKKQKNIKDGVGGFRRRHTVFLHLKVRFHTKTKVLHPIHTARSTKKRKKKKKKKEKKDKAR